MARVSAIVVILVVCLSCCLSDATQSFLRRNVSSNAAAGLRQSQEQQNQGVTLKLALFADLHFGEAASEEWGPAQDRNSTIVMSGILDQEKPDMVVFLGDLLTANNLASPNATKYWDEALSPTLERGIPWASVFGNHDDAAFEWPIEWFRSVNGIPGEDRIDEYFKGTTRADLMANEVQHGLSQSIAGPKSLWPSVSNYVVEIKANSSSAQFCKPKDCDNSTATVMLLYFLDSGGGSYPEVISAGQTAWFREVSEQLNPGQSIPELAFWHIPSQAYAGIAPQAGTSIEAPCVGSINLEHVDPQVAELGFMELISSRPSMKASFVGHNHGLDWCCPYKTMQLCFARHTGHGGYGNWTRGARMVKLELGLQNSNIGQGEAEEHYRRGLVITGDDYTVPFPKRALESGTMDTVLTISTYIHLENGSISALATF